MSLLRSKATQVHYLQGATLTDVTEQSRTWESPDFVFTWDAANDALFIGRPHKFNNFYIAIAKPNTTSSKMTVSYWNPNSKTFTAFTELVDETDGFKKNGFIQWEEPADTPLKSSTYNWNYDLTKSSSRRLDNA